MQGLHVHITGIVQWVGFRPFVYNLATRLELKGWVKNTSAGVEIEVDGDQDTCVRAMMRRNLNLTCTRNFPSAPTRIVDMLAGEMLPRIC